MKVKGPKNRPHLVVTAATVAIAAIAFSAFATVSHRIFYNATESAPRGWYWRTQIHAYRVGMLVFVQLPSSAAALANERRYLPRGIPVLKRIGAAEGTEVCELNGAVRINGRLLARSLLHDGRGRALIAWRGCRVLAAGEYFLLSIESPASFDSRYFGPITYSALQGEAIALWTW